MVEIDQERPQGWADDLKCALKVDARQTIGVGKWRSLEVIETMA